MAPKTFKNKVSPLNYLVPITNSNGTPTSEFQRAWNRQGVTNASIPDVTTAAAVSAILDLLTAISGSLLVRGATQWQGLPPAGDATKFLNGAATPAYAQVKDTDLATTDVTGNNVSSTKHGFAPKSPADATKFLNGAATPAYAQVKDTDLAVTDVTGNNVSITAHGFAPKAPNDATKFLDGTGAYSTPASGAGGGAASIQDDGTNVYIALSDGDGQLVLDGSGDPIFSLEVFPPTAVKGVTGVIDGSNAASGLVGEYVESDIPIGSPVSIPLSATNLNLTSMLVPAGDWDIDLNAIFLCGTSSVQLLTSSISLVTTAFDVTKGRFSQNIVNVVGATNAFTNPVNGRRFNFTVPTTVYAVIACTFTLGTMSAFGTLSARRRR